MGYIAEWKDIKPLLTEYEELGGYVCEVGMDRLDESVIGDSMKTDLPNFFIRDLEGYCDVTVNYNMPETWDRLADGDYDDIDEHEWLLMMCGLIESEELNLKTEMNKVKENTK